MSLLQCYRGIALLQPGFAFYGLGLGIWFSRRITSAKKALNKMQGMTAKLDILGELWYVSCVFKCFHVFLSYSMGPRGVSSGLLKKIPIFHGICDQWGSVSRNRVRLSAWAWSRRCSKQPQEVSTPNQNINPSNHKKTLRNKTSRT